MAALAVYALQSKDESLYKMAVRIRARAIRRAGELLTEIEPQKGGDQKSMGRDRPVDRQTAASSAGLSDRQRKTALRIASIPKDQLESLVESDSPPTIPRLAAMGTKKRIIPKRNADRA